jgi:ABC-2 type transport system permease protein
VFTTLRRQFSIYSAFGAMEIKGIFAYNGWFWMETIGQVVAMFVFTAFWRAVYANSPTLGGLTLQQTLNYILLAQIIAPIVQTRLIFHFGFMVGQGLIAVELTRPVDMQARYYADALSGAIAFLARKLPLLVIAWLFFGLQLPSDPLVWLAFIVSVFLGQAVIFCFDWIFACLAFYSTETWGLSVVKEGIAAFFSGMLLPLALMPEWLRAITNALPFAQALAAPTALLSGITPLSQAPQVWLTQIAWIIGLFILSRLAFNTAIKVVTVQGG